MILTAEAPRMSAAMKSRLEDCLKPDKCTGWECPGGSVQLTKRMIAGNVAVHLQCQTCGRSSGILKRAEVYSWQDLPEWNEGIRTRWDEEKTQAGRERLLLTEEYREKAAREAAERRVEYRRWLMTSPDWINLRNRVLRRSIGQCEACLANRATDVHHVTYRLGKLPPAWELRAVCRQCHDRLHDWTGGEE